MSRKVLRVGLSGAKRVASILGRLSLGIPISSKRFVEISAILLILFTAFTIRFLPTRWGPYLAEYDTYFHYRMANYVVENGFQAWFTWYDPLTWYPKGINVSATAYPGVAFSAALIYLFLKALGINISLLSIAMFFPVVMGTLACLALYFLGKDIGGKEVGLFAAFFLAINSAFISRTSMGFFDNENIGILGMILTFLCFLRSIEEEKPLRNRLSYALATGLSLSYVTVSWGATRYVPVMLALFTFLMILRGDYSRSLLVSYTTSIGLSYFFSSFAPVLGLRYLREISSLLVLSLIPILICHELMKKTEKTSNRIVLIGTIIIVLIGGIWFLESGGYVSSLATKFWGVINPFSRTQTPLVESVAEHRRSSWASFFRDFGVILSLSLMGSYFSLRRIDSKKLLALLYFITSLYFAGSMIRLTLILSAAASLMAAYGLVELARPFMGILFGGPKPLESRRRRLMPRTSPEVGAVFLIALLLISTPTVFYSVEAAYSPGSLAMSAVPAQLAGGGYPQDWIEALTWIKNNLDSKTVVVSWWDYGHWLTGIGDVTTLSDGRTLNGTQISLVAKMFMYNQTGSLQLLGRFNADYILVFLAYNPSQRQKGWPPTGPDEMWPLGENVKWYWMAQIAGLNASDYVVYNQAYKQQLWTAKFKETTLYNLMFEKADPEHFELVFYSSFGFVLIYKIKY